MAYEYIKQTYGVSPEVGRVVYHTVTKAYGVIKRESKSASHYVQVQFEGDNHALPCHPTELQYLSDSLCLAGPDTASRAIGVGTIDR